MTKIVPAPSHCAACVLAVVCASPCTLARFINQVARGPWWWWGGDSPLGAIPDFLPFLALALLLGTGETCPVVKHWTNQDDCFVLSQCGATRLGGKICLLKCVSKIGSDVSHTLTKRPYLLRSNLVILTGASSFQPPGLLVLGCKPPSNISTLNKWTAGRT